MIAISVIIPTWNRSRVIKKAILSALNQTFSSLEVVVVDDGSTDNTSEIVQSIKDSRIKWISGDHTGLPAAVRNRGMKESKGEWIAFLDSDDEWLPDKIDKQITLAKKTSCLAVCSNGYGINSRGEKKIYLTYNRDFIEFNDLLKNNSVILSSAIFHKSLISLCNGLPEDQKYRNAPDYTYWLRISTYTKFAYLNDPLVVYHDDPASSVRRFTKDPYVIRRKTFHNFIEWGFKK